MDYIEFRDLWHEALRAASLQIPHPIGPTERIDLRDMSRVYKLVLFGGFHSKSEPFNLTLSIEWVWNATLSARNATTEEDMLMEIFGDFDLFDDETVPPWLRMDVRLAARLAYGARYPMPEQAQLQSWIWEASNELQTLLPKRYDDGAMNAYSDRIKAGVELLEDGQLSLNGVTFDAWQAIPLPRAWDHPEKRDPGPWDTLVDFAERIAKSMDVLENRLAWLTKEELR